MSSGVPSVLRRIQDALVEGTAPIRSTFEAGEFLLMLTPDDPLVWINYAVPLSDPTPSGIREMVTVFRRESRMPRLELFAELWPELPPMLEAEGFVCEKRMPIMVIERADWTPKEFELKARAVAASDIARLRPALAEAFGVPPPSGNDAGDNRARRNLETGVWLGAMVEIDGTVAGGGYAVGTPTIREIAGIGTREAYRRRGVASATIANLLDRFFEAGGEIAWLTPGDDSAQSVYARLGFKPIAEQVCYELQ